MSGMLPTAADVKGQKCLPRYPLGMGWTLLVKR